jgi:hypothetical protein
MDAPDGSEQHRPYEDMAVAHVLGGLDTDQGRVFRSHLLECSDCRARVGELRAIASDLAGVERDERRQRSVQSVETKQRDEDAPERPAPPPAVPAVPRWLVLVLAVAVVALGSYAFMLRTSNARLEVLLEREIDLRTVFELGEPMEVEFRSAGVDASARVHGNRIALLLDGLDDDTVYTLYLIDDRPDGPRTVYHQLLRAQDGRVVVPLPLRGGEDRLLVTVPDRSPALDPDGQRVLEVLVPGGELEPDTIGSA